jgi:hypothetical protein
MFPSDKYKLKEKKMCACNCYPTLPLFPKNEHRLCRFVIALSEITGVSVIFLEIIMICLTRVHSRNASIMGGKNFKFDSTVENDCV